MCTALAVYASYVAVFALPAQLVVLAWRREAWRRVIGAMAVSVVCWIPLAVLAATRGSGQLFWIPRPNLTTEKQVVLALTSAGFEPNFHPTCRRRASWPSRPSPCWPSPRVLLARRRAPWGVALALSWLLVPVVLMWLESLVGQPIFTPRNLLVSLPAMALLLGWLLTQSRLAWPVLAVLVALRAVALAPSYGTSPENWRAATAYVVRGERPGDCTAFYPLDAQMPFAYYTGKPVTPYIERYDTPRVPVGCARVWLVVSHQGLPTGTSTQPRAFRALRRAAQPSSRGGIRDSVTKSFGYASVIWVQLFYGRGGGSANG